MTIHRVPGQVDLDALRREIETSGGQLNGNRRPIGLQRVSIGADALDELPAAVDAALAVSPRSRSVVALMDATPMRRGDMDLKTDVLGRLEGSISCDVEAVVLGLDRDELHADEIALAEADAAIAGAGCVVSIGSGTVTDIAKDATFRAGIPFVAVQTAVSVNAFSDDMAVLLRSGVKRTVPSHWPYALIADLEVIAGAPAAMNRAGFGELLAMFTAPADWFLANVVGADNSFDDGVVRLFRDGADGLLTQAAGIATGNHAALGELARLMTLTGIAMGVAGRTAPLSGTEHTISHLLDMAAERDGRALAFHGAQVGVAAILVSIAWNRVLREFDPAKLLAREGSEPVGAGHDQDVREAQVQAAFSSLDSTGAAAAECWRDYRRKLELWDGSAKLLAGFAASWDTYRERLGSLVAAPELLVDGLRAAGAPTRFSELTPAVPAEVARWAIASCHLMRDRFTLADLVDLSGGAGHPWDEAFADELLAEAASLGAGL